MAAAVALAGGAGGSSTGVIEATSQVSRFHTETLDGAGGGGGGGVDLQGVQLSVDGKLLLEDAHLQLKPGVRYGLVGRNGVGKSTLLRVMGERTLVGFPAHLRVCYVAQEAHGSEETTVLETVLSVDPEGAALDRAIAELEGALDGGDAAAIAACVAALCADRAAAEADAANAIAAKRSGLRGLHARRKAIAADAAARAALAEAEAAAARAARRQQRRGEGAAGGSSSSSSSSDGGGDGDGNNGTDTSSGIDGDDGDNEAAGVVASSSQPPVSLERAEAMAHDLLNELYERQASADPEGARARAAGILAGLGFDAARQAAQTATLSGGWRMRLSLAAALFAAPHLLLLDEPTNHLDLEATLWLASYLTGPAAAGLTLLVVSHDRAFLDAVAQEIVLLKDRVLRYWSGNYSGFVEARALAYAAKARQLGAMAKQRKHIEDSIVAQNRKARAAGDDKQLKQAASRRKKLEERWGADKTESGKRFQLSKHGYFGTSKRPPVVLEQLDKPVEFKLPEPEPIRYTGPLLQLRAASFRYPGAAAAVLRAVTLDIAMGARLALLGPNGAGKSTLMRLIAGELRPTPPGDEGEGGGDKEKGGGGNNSAGTGNNSSSSDRWVRSGAPPPPPPSMTKAAARAARGLAITALATPTAQAAAAAAATAAGSVERHANLQIGLFSQHCIGDLDGARSVLEHIASVAPQLAEQEARDFLGGFGLGGRLATQRCDTLSGGQKARAALALVLLRRPHVLLLDEPTNHLDLDACEGLAAALRGYAGAVVLASHDVRFIDEVLEGARAPQVWTVGAGGARRWARGESAAEYAAARLERMQQQQQQAAALAGGGGSGAAGRGSSGGGGSGGGSRSGRAGSSGARRSGT